MSKIFKILLKLIKIFGIVVVCLGLLFFIICFMGVFSDNATTDIDKYNKLLKTVEQQDNISHFPVDIPNDAKDIKFYFIYSDYNGALIFLKFDINEEYIKKEFKKNVFINEKTPLGAKQDLYNMPVNLIDENKNNYTYYVIKNEDNEYFSDKYFPYFSGIGIRKDSGAILYYYILPED